MADARQVLHPSAFSSSRHWLVPSHHLLAAALAAALAAFASCHCRLPPHWWLVKVGRGGCPPLPSCYLGLSREFDCLWRQELSDRRSSVTVSFHDADDGPLILLYATPSPAGVRRLPPVGRMSCVLLCGICRRLRLWRL